MIRRLLLAAGLTAGCLPAQLVLSLAGSQVALTQYSFGTTAVGNTVDVQFQLWNSGSSAAAFSTPSLGNPAFSFLNPPAWPQTVAAGAGVSFTIRFAPTQPGNVSSTFTAAGVAATLYGFGLASIGVTLPDGSTVPAPLDFGSVTRGSTAAQTILLTNSTAAGVSVNVGMRYGTAFVIKNPSPVAVAANSSALLEVDFAPTVSGQANDVLEIDQRVFPVTGVGLDPPFPQPSINIQLPNPASAEQGSLTVTLPSASPADGTGEVDLDSASAAMDSGLQFLATGSRTVAFTVKEGDLAAHFGSEMSAAFQTGTSAGDITFTVKLGNAGSQVTLPIAPAVVGFDTGLAQRTSAGLDLQISGFDNTRTASKLTFTFFDLNGATLGPGAITLDESSAFQRFFGSSDLGGLFALRAFFPVNGNPAQVGSVEMQIVNSAGTARTGKLPFTTP
ncbi:MAG TPA: choice-of-anchor D domain-containing protein [Bryobacteraceae bacterium]|nr:choice-of-anchor D domain-containing protein [Bryobacteraceae bacterium]